MTSSRMARSPRAPVPRLSASRAIGRHRVVGELEPHFLEIEVLLVLLDDRVLRLAQDAHQRLVVEVVERRDHRESADELGDEAVLQEVLRLDHRQQVADPALLAALDLGPETHPGAADAILDDLVEADKGAAAQEQHVGGIDLDELLVRMLPPALGGTLATVPSRIFSSACWTPSPDTSRVIDGFSDLRAILSISSM